MVPLLTVTNHFDITNRGLVLMPDFAVPAGWCDRREVVRIVRPDGKERDVEVLFNWTHFVIRDPLVPAEKRSRVVLLFSGLSKSDVPIGSVVLASEAIFDVLVSGKRPNQPPEPTAMSVTPPAAQESRQP